MEHNTSWRPRLLWTVPLCLAGTLAFTVASSLHSTANQVRDVMELLEREIEMTTKTTTWTDAAGDSQSLKTTMGSPGFEGETFDEYCTRHDKWVAKTNAE